MAEAMPKWKRWSVMEGKWRPLKALIFNGRKPTQAIASMHTASSIWHRVRVWVNEAEEAFFHAYMTEGLAIGEREVVEEIASRIGLTMPKSSMY